MRQLLRRRSRAAAGLRLTALAAALAVLAPLAPGALGADAVPFAIRITSPLGRSGLPGRIRIVARLQAPPDAAAGAVRFFVNGALLATVDSGPPYAVEWDDANPFERAELRVEVTGATGDVAHDTVVLPPYEVVEATRITSVTLDTAVLDRNGRFVGNLPPAAFRIEEDGMPQRVDSIVPEEVPASFALLVDASQSMATRFGEVRGAATRLVSKLRAADSVVVAPFNRELQAVTGPTRDMATVTEAIGAIRAGGGTAIFDALAHLSPRFGTGEGHRVVVLITDGYDENSAGNSDLATETLRRSNVVVYVVGIGGIAGISLKGERLLKRVAEATGGRAFFPRDERDLAKAYDTIAADAQHRYFITYTPANQQPDGKWRRITVSVGDPSFRVRTRDGYLAPAPPPVRASLEFTATDAAHRYVDLTREDVRVVEDGKPQEIEVFHEAVSPVSIVLALDSSGSMKRTAPAVQQAAREFVSSLRREDPLALITFADRSTFDHDLSTTREWSFDAIDRYVAAGGTALYDAVSDALIRLKRADGRRVVVVMTDGRDENAKSTGPGSERSWDEVLKLAEEVEAVVYTIGLGNNVDRERLAYIARVTGGDALFPTDVSTLAAPFRGVVEELRKRYVVGYTSTNSRRDGHWRNVEIEAGNGLKVRSRGGYYPPVGNLVVRQEATK